MLFDHLSCRQSNLVRPVAINAGFGANKADS